MEENQISRRPRRTSPVQKNRSKQGIALAILLCVTILVFSLVGLITKDREFSENENRYLAHFPEISLDNIINGDFQEGLEKYINDQKEFIFMEFMKVILKDLFLSIKNFLEMKL